MTEEARERSPDGVSHTSGTLTEFIEELRRRRVIRVGLVYMVAGWLIIQVAQATFPALLLPDWTVTLVVVLTVFGFPVALILAWAFQVEAEHSDHSSTAVHYVVDSHRKLDFVIIAALAAVVIILAIELYARKSVDQLPVLEATQSTALSPAVATEPGVSPRPSIGVLPFLNLSDDRQNEYFADGLAEEILNLLVRVREIDVAARTSSFYFKGKDVDIRTVANRLGVTNVLEGSVRRQGDRIRVTAQLIEAESGFHLWSDTYDRKLVDMFSIQDDVARQVVRALALVISTDSDAVLNRVPTESFEAYQYYLQGRNYLRGEFNATQLESAQSLFEKAIELDSDFADAYAGLCETFLALYRRQRSVGYFEEAERACHRGLTLDANAGELYTALGNLHRLSGQPETAAREFEKAISLNSRDLDAYFGLADTYSQRDDSERAQLTYRRAIDIQPGYWRSHLRMGRFLYYAGRFRDAIESFANVIGLAPDNATGYLNLGSSYFMIGDFSNAASAWQTSIELEPIASSYLNVGSSYFYLGQYEAAADMYRKAIALAPEDFETWGSLGDAYRFMGNDGSAAEAYAKAIGLGEKMLEVNDKDPLVVAPLAQYHAHAGNEKRAAELIARATELAPQDYYVWYFSAIAYASLGRYEAAVDAVEKAVKRGYPAQLIKPDAGLAAVIEDSRVQAIIQSGGG
jgi:TolB-like protein/predicted Zn-dependent protease